MSSSKSLIFLSVIFVLVVGAGATYAYKKSFVSKGIKADIPVARPYAPPLVKSEPVTPINPAVPAEPLPATPPKRPTTELPAEVNLAVPFIPEAPYKKWDLPYSEFCEEASVVMTDGFFRGVSSFTPDEASKRMLAIKDFEEKRFGYYEDTGAEDTATILREFYGRKDVVLKYDPTVAEMKQYLASNKVILMPALGRELKNPHYTGLGPDYHMIVIKGYTKAGYFITNDPGTQFGADYLYRADIIIRAVMDWKDDDGDGYFQDGRRVIIVVG